MHSRPPKHSCPSFTEQSSASQATSKRRKVDNPEESALQTTFWSRLSTIHLTRRAVAEKDRLDRLDRPFFSTRSHQERVRWRSANNRNRDPRLKLFARQGGPDLSDLRGVWLLPMTVTGILTRLVSKPRQSSERCNSHQYVALEGPFTWNESHYKFDFLQEYWPIRPQLRTAPYRFWHLSRRIRTSGWLGLASAGKLRPDHGEA